MKKTILIISVFFILMSFSTSANAIWLLVGNYKAPDNPHDCLSPEHDCLSNIPILREGWILHPNIVITRFHNKGHYPSSILYFNESGEQELTAYMIFDLPDGGGFVAYISSAPLDVEFTMANMVNLLHEKSVTMRDIYTLREFYVNVLGEYERGVEMPQDYYQDSDSYLLWAGNN